MSGFNLECLVLKHQNSHEADRLYTLFSPVRGRFLAYAKGVRKISSRRSGSLDTLNRVEVFLSESKTGYSYISEVKVLQSYKYLKSDLTLLKRSLYLLELINKAIWEDEGADDVYNLLLTTLDKFTATTTDLDARSEHIVNKFELELMQLLGYRPEDKFLMLLKANTQKRLYRNNNGLLKNYVADAVSATFKSLEM